MKILMYFLWFLSFNWDFVLIYGSTKQSCPMITIKNGIAKRRSRSRMVRFKCNRGYFLAGEMHSMCSHGKWDPLPPKCVRPTCKPIGQQPNNNILWNHPSHSGAVQHFLCKTGYTLKGPSAIYCDGMKWDNNAPICLPWNTKPKLFCDFETEDLCGYTHDLNHDFDWKRENYNTPSGSIGTGPSFDHTKGMLQDGYYMYIESSSKNENDTARLLSPVYDKMDGEVCIEFFYHMFGSTIGSLRVYLRKASEKWNFNPKAVIFSKSGNQGDKWYRGYERLGKIDDDFQIIFEGVRGHGYVSDIAIDDIKIINNCKAEESITSTTEDNIGTEIIPIIDSCDKRCGQKESVGNDSYRLTCDCDDDCFDNNRCCPDYYDICNTLTTESNGLTTVIEETTTNTVTKSPVSKTTPKITKSLVRLSSTSTRPISKVTTPRIPTTTPTNTTKPAILPPVIVTKPIIIHIQPPPTTPDIIRKVFPTSTPLPNITDIHYSKPITEQVHKEIDGNDIEEVPRPTKNDEGLLIPDDDGSFSKEYWSDENDNRFDTPYQRNFSVNDKLLSQLASDSPNVNVLSIVISVIGIGVVASIVVFVVVRKYRWPRRRIHFSNGESQSDVRFLTNEEIIDLSLDTECYDN
ncbi:unnamed protein product [Phaedon cochleariae]|uniref:Uncharacterized protein n=1 Tax=Phaedon cochleariae TaxID=80249 RepID=A0A9P0DRN7_PHACE|nr:unnamed protein product [Phaedon cochleariae]